MAKSGTREAPTLEQVQASLDANPRVANIVAEAMLANIVTSKMFDGDELRRQVAENLKAAFPGIEDPLDQLGPLLWVLGFTANPLRNTLGRLIRDFCRDAATALVDQHPDKLPVHVRDVLWSLQREVSKESWK